MQKVKILYKTLSIMHRKVSIAKFIKGKSNAIYVKGRTTIVITHHLSTIVNATKIVIVDRGTVVECGRRNDSFLCTNI